MGPIIIKAKILLQQTWQLCLDWDESVPMQIYSTWKTYQEQMHSLKDLYIARHVICINPIRIEMHVFLMHLKLRMEHAS